MKPSVEFPSLKFLLALLVMSIALLAIMVLFPVIMAPEH